MNRKYIFSLILIVGMIAGTLPTSNAVVLTSLEFDSTKIAFDLYHGGYHANDIDNLVANITAVANNNNTVFYINETWSLPADVDVLFLTESDGKNWTTSEIEDVTAWMELGSKLLWVAGDSDYAGLFDPTQINSVLDDLGAIVRLDGTSISDPDFNDGATYRVAAPYFGVGDPLYDTYPVLNASEGATAGAIFHGPCSIIAFNGYDYRDLRYGESLFPERVWTLMRYSENATADDTDVSEGVLDLYANLTANPATGNYPALVYEHMINIDSHIIAGGEAIYSDYKYMYDQKTESDFYNNGTHFGQVIVNNILNWLLPLPEVIPDDTSFSFALIPLAFIGVIYAISRRKK